MSNNNSNCNGSDRNHGSGATGQPTQPDSSVDSGSTQVFVTGVVAGALIVLTVMFLFGLQRGAQESGKNDLVASTTTVSVQAGSPGFTTEDTKETYSSLNIDEVVPSEGSVTVRGNTDLPDGSVISVDLNVAKSDKTDAFVGEHDHVMIVEGKFEAKLAITPREEFKEGLFAVTVLFTPRGQSESVLSGVGINGEKLSGELMQDKKAYKVLVATSQHELDLNITAPTYVFDTPDKFPVGSPEQTLALYIQAWRDRDWEQMSKYCSRSWLNNVKDPASDLELKHFYKVLQGFEVQNIERVSDVQVKIEYRIVYEDAIYNLYNREVNAVIVKETAPGVRDKAGTWGVDPNSTSREDVK